MTGPQHKISISVHSREARARHPTPHGVCRPDSSSRTTRGPHKEATLHRSPCHSSSARAGAVLPPHLLLFFHFRALRASKNPSNLQKPHISSITLDFTSQNFFNTCTSITSASQPPPSTRLSPLGPLSKPTPKTLPKVDSNNTINHQTQKGMDSNCKNLLHIREGTHQTPSENSKIPLPLQPPLFISTCRPLSSGPRKGNQMEKNPTLTLALAPKL